MDTPSPAGASRSLAAAIRNEGVLHLMILPAVVLTILFSYLPLYGILIAFKKFDLFAGVFGSPWAGKNGLEHFFDLFRSPSFAVVMRNTLSIAALKIVLLSFPSVILAIMFNEVRRLKFKSIAQTISYLPHFVSWVVLGGLIISFLDPSERGPLNMALMKLGVLRDPVNYLASSSLYWPLLILSEFFKDVGWGSIIFLGVIATIDQELYEAVDIDGGGRMAKIRFVTWPFLKGTFIILFILSCGSIMSGTGATFDQCYILGSPVNRNVSDILDTYVLRVGLNEGRYSYATAVGLFKAVLNFGLLFLANRLSKALTDRSLF